jgi:hypothetical protein
MMIMNPKSKNYFNLPESNKYACAVWSYNVSLGLLSIKAVNRTRTDEVWWLTFLNVNYFEGPMMWFGADFEIGTADETLALCHKIGITRNNYHTDEMFLKNKVLFKVTFEVNNSDSNSVGEVRILAIKATASQEKSDALRY